MYSQLFIYQLNYLYNQIKFIFNLTTFNSTISMLSDFKQIQNYFSEAIEAYCQGRKESQDSKESYMQILREKCRLKQLPQMVNSSVQAGLSAADVQNNKRLYGENVFLRRKIKTLRQIFMQIICDQTLIILIFAAIISIVVQYFFGEDQSRFWVDGVSILFAVIICSLVGTISNYQKQQQFADLDKMTELTYNYDVIRGGKRVQLYRNQIVSGDMIIINTGMQIPADCIICKAIDVIVDESAITGQSIQLIKNVFEKCNRNGIEDGPLMVSGSTVVSGQGIMMAVIVGRNSHNGKNFQMLFSKDEEEQKTPLEQKLQQMAEKIGLMGLIAGIAIIIILVIRLVINDVVSDGFNVNKFIPEVVKAFIIGIVVLVAAIPEGLPLAVTLTLAFSMKQMHKQNILVRKLVSCETMGSSHYICTDKTGTITKNQMEVRKILNFKIHQIDSSKKQKFNQEYLDMLGKAISHNSSAILQPMVKGSQTQIALLKFIQNQAPGTVKRARQSVKEADIFLRLPFNSMRKRMTTGVNDDDGAYVFTSGASERILNVCINIMDTNGSQSSIKDQKTRLKNQIDQMGNQGLRVVGLGYKKLDNSEIKSSSQLSSKSKDQIHPSEKGGFTLLGFFGIQDLPREQSKQSIEKALRSRIKIIMITGDSTLTAKKIAKEVGIIREGFNKTVEGSELMQQFKKRGLLGFKKQDGSQGGRQQFKDVKEMEKIILNNEQDYRKFDEVVDGLAVMSRSRPEHKYILVDGLIKRGNVVAVTGDGSNDAPALKRASIGLAMGQIGTQSAKNASDIVVLDDRFDSIVRTIVWGRNVFNSIRRFLQFQLTINLFLIFVTLLSSVLIRQSVFNAVQILWFNLIMDSLAALALAAQPPNEEQLLNQPPNSKDQSLLTPTMIKHIIGQSIYQLLVVVILLFTGFLFLPQYADQYDTIIGTDLQAKYYQGQPEGTVQDGKLYNMQGEDNYKVYFDKYGVYSRHLTIIFNVVVFLQVFNFFCCRKVKDQFNLLKGLFSSLIFWSMIAAIIAVQIIAIQFINTFFGLYVYGLTIQQWVISVIIGSTSLIITMLLRFLCIAKPPKEGQKHQDQKQQSKGQSLSSKH